MELADRPGCYVWNPHPQENVTVTWSGGCSNNLTEGDARVRWYQNDELIQIWETRLQAGRADGPFVQRRGDRALEAEGQDVNSDATGIWTFYWADGSRDTGRYVNGERSGHWTEGWHGGTRAQGIYVDGERHGTWTLFRAEAGDDNVVQEVGPYVNGERHGSWTGYNASGNMVGTIRFENGRRLGGSEGALEVGAVATLTSLQRMFPPARSLPARAVTPGNRRAKNGTPLETGSMGVTGGTQDKRLVVSPLALAHAVASGVLPAAAQSGSEAIACVGSGIRNLATGPIISDMDGSRLEGSSLGRSEHEVWIDFDENVRESNYDRLGKGQTRERVRWARYPGTVFWRSLY